MVSTYLIVVKNSNTNKLSISGPFLKNEVDKMFARVSDLNPKATSIKKIAESSFKKNWEKDYHDSFLTRPLYFLSTHLSSLGIMDNINLGHGFEIAFNSILFLNYNKEERTIGIAFTKHCGTNLAAEITLICTNYLVKQLRLVINPMCYLQETSRGTLKIHNGEFAAQKELVDSTIFLS